MENNMDAEITLATRQLISGEASLNWSNKRGSVEYNESYFNLVHSPGYVYSACTDFVFVV